MTKLIPIITIDGPSGSGKGTISRMLARELGWHYLDSGALYRVLAYAAQRHAVSIENESALEVLAAHLDVQFVTTGLGESPSVIFEGKDVSHEIRSEECGNIASKIAAFKSVRLALVERQRAFRESPGLVADGRDMGTSIFPDAKFKFFLQASPQERARRRLLQLKEKGDNVKLETVLEELNERDARDKDRHASPTKPAQDAHLIETTALSVNEVFQKILDVVQSSNA